MNFFAVFNSLFHSRKFQAYGIGLIVAFLVPLINNYAHLNLDPTVVTGLVLSSVGGAAAYGVATGIEDGKKAQAAAAAHATIVSAAIASDGDTGEQLQAVQAQGLLGGGAGVDFAVTIGVQAFLSTIKNPKKREQTRDIAARVVKETVAAFGDDAVFRQKAGLD